MLSAPRGVMNAVWLELRRIGPPKDSMALNAMGFSGRTRELPSPAEVLARLQALPTGADARAVDEAMIGPPTREPPDARDLIDYSIFSNNVTTSERISLELERIAPTLPPDMVLNYPPAGKLERFVKELNDVADDAGFEAFARVLVAHGGVHGRLMADGD